MAKKRRGKVHGMGGRKGHRTKDVQRQAAREQKLAQRRARQYARFLRKVDRRSEREVQELIDFVSSEIDRITVGARHRRVTRNTRLFRSLAYQEWFTERMSNIDVVQPDGTIRKPTPEETDFLKGMRDSFLADLRKKMPEQEIRAQIDKWKRRIGKPGY